MLPVPQDRMSGRRSSSIVSRTLLGRRASVYVTNAQQDPAKLISDINVQLALFRDLLIHIGQPHDCPELRERVRRLRRTCVEATKQTSQLVLPTCKKSTSEGCSDQPQLVLLYFMSQLLLRELAKCHRLVQLVPMDMTSYYENRAGPSNFGNVISQILLCKQITPDFNQEELCSIAKDTQEINRIVSDIQEYLPQHENLNHLGATRPTLHLKGMTRMAYGETSGEDLSTKVWAYFAVCLAQTTSEGDMHRLPGGPQNKLFQRTLKSKHQCNNKKNSKCS